MSFSLEKFDSGFMRDKALNLQFVDNPIPDHLQQASGLFKSQSGPI